MGPYRNPLETRSRRYAPRQYVSETHDHKPDAPTHRRPANEECAPVEETQPE
jgi:hypothetical protein